MTVLRWCMKVVYSELDFRQFRPRDPDMNRTARRRYEKEFPKILRKDGDNCGVCRAPLTHNAQTFGGLLPNGEVVLTSNCCVRKLETVMGSGVYINQNTDAIVSVLEQAPGGQLPAPDVFAAVDRMRSGVDAIDAMTKDVMRKGGVVTKPTAISLTDTPWKSDDAAWFERNKDRTHRMRPMHPGEREQLPPNLKQFQMPEGHRFEILVRQIVKGQRIRSLFCRNIEIDIPDSDELIHAIFDMVAAGEGDGVIRPERIEAIAEEYRRSAAAPKH